MRSRVVELPYGETHLSFSLPSAWRVEIADPPDAPDSLDVRDLAANALRHPLDSPPLATLAGPRSRITLVVPDLTRPCPTAVLLDALLGELESAGVVAGNVTVLLGLGMHRRLDEEEVRVVLGSRASRVRLVQAQGSDEAGYVDLGTWATLSNGRTLPGAVPVRLHPAALDSDLLLSVGVVEPHQVAGFSGGGKSVGIGVAGAGTIGALHGIPFLLDPGTRLGVLDGNPFRETVDAIAARAGLRFVLNVAMSWKGSWISATAGSPAPVIRHLARVMNPWTPVSSPSYDLVLAGVGRGKDANLYQATRALTYLAFSPEPVMAEGGWIVLAARCPEGGGEGPGEREFMKQLRGGRSPQEVVLNLEKHGYRAGGQRAFLVARALCRYRGMVVGAAGGEALLDTHFSLAKDPTEAVGLLPWKKSDAVRVLVVPNALAILPRPAREGGNAPGSRGPG